MGIFHPITRMEGEESPKKPVPKNLNPKLKGQLLGKKKKRQSASAYMKGILQSDRILLGQAITLIESARTEHQQLAREVVEKCLPHSGQSIRLGITGPPGVGKSTFIEAFGLHLIEQGHRVAVLAIDPSSQLSKGSILGDKTRMAKLSASDEAFIRPTPAGKSLGGVARYTRESIILCEAAGFDVIIVETVGVGQSEIAVHSLVDCFLLLLLPGAGDELQGIKRGIVEMADLLAVNKADEDRLAMAKKTRRAYRNALHLFPPKKSRWTPKVHTCSALTSAGIPEIWTAVQQFQAFTQENNHWQNNRKEQARYWLYESVNQQLQTAFFHNVEVKNQLKAIEKAVIEGKLSSFAGAAKLMACFFDQNPK